MMVAVAVMRAATTTGSWSIAMVNLRLWATRPRPESRVPTGAKGEAANLSYATGL
jgi:hypothetical protein